MAAQRSHVGKLAFFRPARDCAGRYVKEVSNLGSVEVLVVTGMDSERLPLVTAHDSLHSFGGASAGCGMAQALGQAQEQRLCREDAAASTLRPGEKHERFERFGDFGRLGSSMTESRSARKVQMHQRADASVLISRWSEGCATARFGASWENIAIRIQGSIHGERTFATQSWRAGAQKEATGLCRWPLVYLVTHPGLEPGTQ